MATKVSASCSVNMMSPLTAKSSGILDFAIQSTALDIGYVEYRNKDYRLGFSKEIGNAYRVGVVQKSDVHFENLGNQDMNNPVNDFNDQSTVRVYDVTSSKDIGFMPIVEIKSDKNPDGVMNRPPQNRDRIKAELLGKAMNLDLASMTDSLLGSQKIPQQGSADWVKYSKEYRNSGSELSETAYRRKLVKDEAEKKKGMKDVTDVSAGYFGTFETKATIMPQAMFYTFLQCLERTTLLKPDSPGTPGKPGVGNPGDPGYVPPIPPTGPVPIGSGRKFRLKGSLYDAVYNLNGYIVRERKGVVAGNTKKSRGYSKVIVNLEKDVALEPGVGLIKHTDYDAKNTPYFDKKDWESGGKAIPDMHVIIQVQTGYDTYDELVMVDLYQETTIEGKGKTRRSNSGNQSKQQKELTWTEAYIAESFIPLTEHSMKKVKLFERGNLMTEAKCYFVQAVNVYKEKWYETKFFKALLFVAQIAMAVIPGLQGGAIAIQAIIVRMAVAMAISFAVNLLIKALVDMGIISSAVAIALIAVVSVYGGAMGVGAIKMDFTLITTVMRVLEATGKVFAAETVKNTEEYKKKMEEIKKEEDKLAEKDEELSDLHTPAGLGLLMIDLQRLLDTADMPLFESRDEFLRRTGSMQLQTQPISYSGLKSMDIF